MRDDEHTRHPTGPLGTGEPHEPRKAGDPDASATDGQLRAFALNLLDSDLAEVSVPLERPGLRVGPWRLVHEIGQGGMGVVWLAERADGQYQQQAALKLIRSGVDSEDIQGRFLTERQILAQLQHPHIASLLDGGVTLDGRPYFAMEYVDGVPIDRHCRDERLSIEERIELFIDVCAAVQAAHQNLVVHRDLKPSNMLVSAQGEVKLLDFGIAKLIDPVNADATQLINKPMTPAYAAPEQWMGKPVTTATDVHGLGIVLYRLLTGCRPYGPVDDVSALHDRVLNTEPKRPSAAVAVKQGDAAGIRLALHVHERTLRGDLDNILLKALAKEPTERYASASALADDLRRYLKGLPVEARPSSALYRVRKFVARHRLGTSAAALAALLVLAGVVGTLWQARVASFERDVARNESAKARQVQDYLIEVFSQSDPDQSDDAPTARELLDQGVARVESDLASQPESQAEMMAVFAKLQRSLGDFHTAERLIDRSIEIRGERFGEFSLQTADSMAEKAWLFVELGRDQQAHELATQVLKVRTEMLEPPHVQIAESLHQLGTIVERTGKFDDAADLYLDALSMRQALDAGSLDVARTMVDLASLEMSLNRYDDAGKRLFAARDIVAKIAPDHSAMADIHHTLSDFYWHNVEPEKAVESMQAALDLRKQLYSEIHPDVLFTVGEYARLMRLQARFDEAEQLIRESLAKQHELFEPNNPSLAVSYNRLALLLYDRGDFQGAAEAMREAVSIWRAAHGDDHPSIITGKANLGAILRELGDYGQAEANMRAVLEYRLEQYKGEPSSKIATSLFNLAQVHHLRGDIESAEALHRESLAMRRELLEPMHPTLTLSLRDIARIEIQKGRTDQAERLLDEAMEIATNAYEGAHPRIAEILQVRSELAVARDQPQLATEHCQAAVDMLVDRLGDKNKRTADARIELARHLIAAERHARAREELEKAISAMSAILRPEDPRLAAARELLRTASAGQGA